MKSTLEWINEIINEYNRASQEFNPFASAHEGIAVIEKEFMELRDEIYWGHNKTTDRQLIKNKMKKETIQLAAMSLRFLIDIIEKEKT